MPELNYTHIARCHCCYQDKVIKANVKDFLDWQAGKLIQNAMPYLSVDDRELLISGTCGPCWEKIFGPTD
jgi:hypothetical protein